jgi:superfamily I DNA/RNA helicase
LLLPVTGKRHGVLTTGVKDVPGRDEAERLRLYVAVTRAIDRLIVSGSIDSHRKADEKTPIGCARPARLRLSLPARSRRRSN